MEHLTLIIPAKNEKESLPSVLNELKKYNLKIIVVLEKEDLDTLIEKLSPIGAIDNIRHVFEEEIEKEKGISDGIYYLHRSDEGLNKAIDKIKLFDGLIDQFQLLNSNDLSSPFFKHENF